ncbi:unnamed protein product [Cuscuta campestris]|uniref:Protein kinase domain-containing protein n=1 Tax=Cuscuta campestris TaxID=132261 RepID=A0A484N743_9ASTE|nr:unnamed protein product [Cuscuta campestris]
MAPSTPPDGFRCTSGYLRKNFEVQEKLGAGGFAHVYKCKNLVDDGTYALKVVPFRAESYEDTRREAIINARLQGPHITRYYQAWIEDGASWPGKLCWSSDSDTASDTETSTPEYIFYVLTELCLGDLNSFLAENSLDQAEKFRIFGEIVSGVSHIHDKDIVHRDLSTQNIFFDGYRKMKIGDFGLAGVLNAEGVFETSASLGNLIYMAPEIKKDSIALKKSNIYSLGIICFEIFSDFESISERYREIQNLKMNTKDATGWLKSLWSSLMSMLDENPSERPSAERILALLQAKGDY